MSDITVLDDSHLTVSDIMDYIKSLESSLLGKDISEKSSLDELYGIVERSYLREPGDIDEATLDEIISIIEDELGIE